MLAGGLATRLPRKLALRIGSESMLERAMRQLGRSGYPVVLSVRKPLPEMGDADQIVDRFPEKGPLGGLASVAARIATPLLFAAAADLPNLDEHAIEAVVLCYEAAIDSGERPPQAVIPRHADGEIEPLAALFDTQALRASAEVAIAHDRLRVSAAIASLRTVYHDIAAAEETRYHNVNTAEDFERIRSS